MQYPGLDEVPPARVSCARHCKPVLEKWLFQRNDVCPSPAPSPPGRVVAVSGGRGDLLVGWTPPKQPNGRLLQYTVTTRTKSKRTGGSTGDLSFAKRTQPMGDGHLPQLNWTVFTFTHGKIWKRIENCVAGILAPPETGQGVGDKRTTGLRKWPKQLNSAVWQMFQWKNCSGVGKHDLLGNSWPSHRPHVTSTYPHIWTSKIGFRGKTRISQFPQMIILAVKILIGKANAIWQGTRCGCVQRLRRVRAHQPGLSLQGLSREVVIFMWWFWL